MQNVEILESPSAAHAEPRVTATLPPPVASPALSASADIAAFPPVGATAATGATLPPILVADDDPDDIFFISRLIKKTGVANPVKTFDDGSEIVNYLGARLSCEVARRRMPQLLFLDLRMAGLGGFGFLEWAREQKGLQPLAIVVLSNSNHPEDVSRALALGAHRYLVKYPCMKTITSIVRSVYPFTLA